MQTFSQDWQDIQHLRQSRRQHADKYAVEQADPSSISGPAAIFQFQKSLTVPSREPPTIAPSYQ